MYNISTGILDNDNNGTTGVGTIFWGKVTTADTIIEYHEFGLLDIISGKFSWVNIKEKYNNENMLITKESHDKWIASKNEYKENRKSSVKENSKLNGIIDIVIDENPKIVAEINLGKDKAKNALVGKVISKLKSIGESIDNLEISVLIDRKLSK